MTRGQRILVIGGLLVLAWMLHTLLCEWEYKIDTYNRTSYQFLTWRHGPSPRDMSGRATTGIVSGLFAQGGRENAQLSAVFGLVVPLFLAGTSLYLVLGWRAAARRARGLCPRCGYDLRGSAAAPSDTCPECGWSRTTEAAPRAGSI